MESIPVKIRRSLVALALFSFCLPFLGGCNPDRTLTKGLKKHDVDTIRKALEKGADPNLSMKEGLLGGVTSHVSSAYNGATSFKIYFSGTPLVEAATP